MEGLTEMILNFSSYLKDYIFCGKKRNRNHLSNDEDHFKNDYLTKEIMKKELDQINNFNSYYIFEKINSIRENKLEGDKINFPFISLSEIEKISR
jgi:hypothetical protein